MKRRFRRRGPLVAKFGGWLAIAALLLCAVILAVFRPDPVGRGPAALNAGQYAVERVVDGDTIRLQNGAMVRLLGVDTPETVHPNRAREPWGNEATAFSRSFLDSGQVELQFDKERKDRYGRFLAYAWADGRMLNEELLRAGLGKTLPQYRYSESMKRRFRKAEDEAKAGRRGIWSAP